MISISKRTSLISNQSFKQAGNGQKDRSVVPRFAGKQLFTKTKSKEIVARANSYLLMLILNVKEYPWKLPDGKIAIGFTPLAMKTFCSSWMGEMLVAVVGTATTSAGVLGTALVDLQVEKDGAACSGIDLGLAFHSNFRCLRRFMASHCFNLPCLYVHWRNNGDCCGPWQSGSWNMAGSRLSGSCSSAYFPGCCGLKPSSRTRCYPLLDWTLHLHLWAAGITHPPLDSDGQGTL